MSLRGNVSLRRNVIWRAGRGKGSGHGSRAHRGLVGGSIAGQFIGEGLELGGERATPGRNLGVGDAAPLGDDGLLGEPQLKFRRAELLRGLVLIE